MSVKISERLGATGQITSNKLKNNEFEEKLDVCKDTAEERRPVV